MGEKPSYDPSLAENTDLMLRAIGGAIEELLEDVVSEPTGFALLIFPFNTPGISNYISNASRPRKRHNEFNSPKAEVDVSSTAGESL